MGIEIPTTHALKMSSPVIHHVLPPEVTNDYRKSTLSQRLTAYSTLTLEQKARQRALHLLIIKPLTLHLLDHLLLRNRALLTLKSTTNTTWRKFHLSWWTVRRVQASCIVRRTHSRTATSSTIHTIHTSVQSTMRT